MDFIFDNWKEVTAFAVVLYLFVRQQSFLNKDLRGDVKEISNQLKENAKIIKQDSDNTKDLKNSIDNHLAHAIKDLTGEIKKLGDKK